MIICAGNNETFPFATPIGVGLIESAINLTQLCLFDKPDYLVFIGSAGSYGRYKIFDIVESSSASNIELGFFNDSCYTPIDNIVKSNRNLSKSSVIINSSNYISTDKILAKNFIDYNIDLENMEFYSVLKVAQQFNIDAFGIFVVTNYTNKNAHKDFISNHKIALDKLVRYLEEKSLIVPHGTINK